MLQAQAPVRSGFTLLELCVVVAILMVLLALALPAVQAVRGAADKVRCKNNLHQVGTALHTFHAEHFRLPGRNWTLQLLPHIEQEALFRQFDKLKDWRDPANAQVVSTPIRLYQCPVEDRERQLSGTFKGQPYTAAIGDYVSFGADGGMGRRFEEFSDGLSHTLLIGEHIGVRPWPDAELLPLPVTLRSQHAVGSHALMGDKGVRFIRAGVSPSLLNALVTANGRELVDLSSLD